jgi:hypothetical protein
MWAHDYLTKTAGAVKTQVTVPKPYRDRSGLTRTAGALKLSFTMPGVGTTSGLGALLGAATHYVTNTRPTLVGAARDAAIGAVFAVVLRGVINAYQAQDQAARHPEFVRSTAGTMI